MRLHIDLHTDLSRSAQSDRLADTINYDELCAIAYDLGTTRTFHLLEALAGAIAETIALGHPGVGLEIEVRKLNPPCPGSPSFSAVRLARAAGD